MTDDVSPEPFALERRGFPLRKAARTVLPGTWLPAPVRNPISPAPPAAPAAPQESASSSDRGEEPWWLEAAEWGEADSSKPAEESHAGRETPAAAEGGDRVHDAALRDQRGTLAAPPRQATFTRSAGKSDDAPGRGPAPAEAPRPEPSRPIAAIEARESDLPARTPEQRGLDRRDTPDTRLSGTTRHSSGTGESPALPASPSVVIRVDEHQIVVPAPAPPPENRVATPAPLPPGVRATRHVDPTSPQRRPPRTPGETGTVTDPVAIQLEAMGIRRSVGGPRAEPLPLPALPAANRQPQVVQIDRVAVTVQASPAAPTAPSTPAAAAAPVAQASPGARAFRNPWASYHVRRD